MKRIVLLGASGSIGLQTVDVVRHHSDLFSIRAISVGHNIAQLETLLAQLPHVQKVCVAEESDHDLLSRKYPHLDWCWGEEGLMELAAWSEYDVLVNAVVGFRGLHPTLCAIAHHHDVALANKESLVTGGDLVKAALNEHGVHLYPIDSEHSAVFQCLQGNDPREVRRLIITASGGSFRARSRDELNDVSVQEALHHPNWNMGGRITIDSATMMNKGFEVIEAHHLFNLPYEQIDVVIHRESIIHSMVEYQDHAIIAQMGTADMRLPIQYALFYPDRRPMPGKRLDFYELAQITFEKPDMETFFGLKLAYDAQRIGGSMPTVYNAANEKAVGLFLDRKIAYLQIPELIREAMEQHKVIENPNVEEILETEASVYDFIEKVYSERQ